LERKKLYQDQFSFKDYFIFPTPTYTRARAPDYMQQREDISELERGDISPRLTQYIARVYVLM
jgi:hypothetical protein